MKPIILLLTLCVFFTGCANLNEPDVLEPTPPSLTGTWVVNWSYNDSTFVDSLFVTELPLDTAFGDTHTVTYYPVRGGINTFRSAAMDVEGRLGELQYQNGILKPTARNDVNWFYLLFDNKSTYYFMDSQANTNRDSLAGTITVIEKGMNQGNYTFQATKIH